MLLMPPATLLLVITVAVRGLGARRNPWWLLLAAWCSAVTLIRALGYEFFSLGAHDDVTAIARFLRGETTGVVALMVVIAAAALLAKGSGPGPALRAVFWLALALFTARFLV